MMKQFALTTVLVFSACMNTSTTGEFIDGTVFGSFLDSADAAMVAVEVCREEIPFGQLTFKGWLGKNRVVDICTARDFSFSAWGYLSFNREGNWFCRELGEQVAPVSGTEQAVTVPLNCNPVRRVGRVSMPTQ